MNDELTPTTPQDENGAAKSAAPFFSPQRREDTRRNSQEES
jgi:hypothetical protein